MELQTHFVNKFVTQVLEHGVESDISESGDRFRNLLAKIRNTNYTTVTLSDDEVETLLLALLQEMQNYTSVTVKEYYLKETEPTAAA